MVSPIPRLLLATAAAIFALGGAMHAAAYTAKALPSIGSSNLPPFLGAEIKVLWLADSTMPATWSGNQAFASAARQ